MLGGAGGEAGGNGGRGDDTGRPTIIDVEPADGAIGVRGDATISVTFSKPMNRKLTEEAFRAAVVPDVALPVVLSWNTAGTTLTVAQTADLPYAMGALDVEAIRFDLAIESGARDEAGNYLSEDFEWTFRTLRQITHRFDIQAYAATFSVSTLQKTSFLNCETDSAPLRVGDNESSSFFQSFFQADLTEVPDDIVEWLSATLDVNQPVGANSSVVRPLGSLFSHHLRSDPLSDVTWDIQVLRYMQGLLPSPGGTMLDVVEAIADDYDERDTFQVRIAFDMATDSDGTAYYTTFDCPGSLTATFLAP